MLRIRKLKLIKGLSSRRNLFWSSYTRFTKICEKLFIWFIEFYVGYDCVHAYNIFLYLIRDFWWEKHSAALIETSTIRSVWKNRTKSDLISDLLDILYNHGFKYGVVTLCILYYMCLKILYAVENPIFWSLLFQVSILPPLASVFMTNIAAQVADNLIANGVETTTVRSNYEVLLCLFMLVPEMYCIPFFLCN